MQRRLSRLAATVLASVLCLMAAAQPQYAPNSPFTPGDTNEDCVIDIADVNAVINTMLGKSVLTDTQLRNADYNHDGRVDIADVNGVINLMLGKGLAHVDPMSLVVETRDGSRDVFPLSDKPQLSFSGSELLVESRYATSYYGRNQLYQIYYMPYSRANSLGKAQRAALNDNPNQFAVYIYRNDNDFNAHLNIDVESIRFSPVGTDSAWYDNALVQEVWTPDTVYRTPISAVDSITFEAPKPVLRDNLYVVNEGNVGYVTYSDDNTIRFMASTPSSVLPVVGQVIVSELFIEPVPDGFAGRVTSVSTLAGGELEYVCEDVTFDDIFEQLVLVAKATNNPNVPGKRCPPRHLFGLDNPNGEIITLDDVFPEATLGYDEFPVSLKYHPVVTIDYVLYVQRNQPKHIRLVVGAEHTFTPQFKLEQTLGEVKKTAWLFHKGNDWTEAKPKEVSIGHGFKLMWDLGVYAKMAGKISLNGSVPITVKHALGFDYHGYGVDWDNLSLVHDFGMDLGRPDLKLSVSGSASAGIAALIGVNFVHRKLASISGTLNIGPKFTASLDLSAMNTLEDPTWYNALKDSKVKGDINIGLDVDYMILNKRFTMTPGQGWPGVKPNQPVAGPWDLKFEWDIPWKEWKLLPSFTTPVINDYGNNRVLASTQPDDNLIVPVWVGMGLFDRQGNKVAEDIDNGADHFYWGKSDSRLRQFSMTATSPLTPDEYYTCRPLVRIMDFPTMTAWPAKEFRTTNLSVTPQQLSLSVEETKEAQIKGCSGSYEVNNPKKDVVTAKVVGSVLKVTGLKAGSVVLQLSDKETGETQDVNVTVTNEPLGDLVLSTNSVEVNEGQTATVSFYAGSGQYEVESSTPTVATATLQGEGAQQEVVIEGIKQGIATIVVKDTQFDKVATIAVTVNNSGDTPQTQTFTVNGVSFKMVAVEGGTFMMGASDDDTEAFGWEKPAHQVTLRSYSIGQTEVTQELWLAVMGSNPSYIQESTDSDYGTNLQRPVECVNWNDCQTFITKLNQLTGKNFRLPTEAEWEYAARGGNKSQGYKYAGSNTIDDVAWYIENAEHVGSSSPDYGTHTVATKAPNELGLYDMTGNVWEWCHDWYGDYSSDAQTNPTGPASGSCRVFRGGGWFSDVVDSRVSCRSYVTPSYALHNRGLRLALDDNDPEPQTETTTIPGTNVSFKMVAVEGGTFMMGASDDDTEAKDDERPAHQVTLSSFAIGETEVTQELWQAVMGNNPSHSSGDMNRPVESVTWAECQEFITNLNQITGKNFRLPTEAEWEYAARGGKYSKGYKYSGGNTLNEIAWYGDNSGNSTHPVARKTPNELGIYDMSGNVWEWCQDWYDSNYYNISPTTNPTGPISGTVRMYRGGSYVDNGIYCLYLRVTDRCGDRTGYRNPNIGLRLAL